MMKNRLFDVAANLTDSTFQGIYHGKKKHIEDRKEVIARARDVGCDKFLVAAGNLQDFVTGKKIYEKGMYLTAGVHPCRANQAVKDPQLYFNQLQKQIINTQPGQLVAIGQCGLDYDRLQYSTKQAQLKIFPLHFKLSQKYQLPLYLHNRNTGHQFFDIMKANHGRYPSGLLHSFTGSMEELEQALELGLFIGVNGCSMKTKENVEMVKKIPMEKMVLETDCPYCEIRKSHAGYEYVDSKELKQKAAQKHSLQMAVKGRNQPSRIRQVLQAVSNIRQTPSHIIAQITYKNSLHIFNIKDD